MKEKEQVDKIIWRVQDYELSRKEATYRIVELIEEAERKAFEAGWKKCESYFDPMSEIGGAPIQVEADFKAYREAGR